MYSFLSSYLFKFEVCGFYLASDAKLCYLHSWLVYWQTKRDPFSLLPFYITNAGQAWLNNFLKEAFVSHCLLHSEGNLIKFSCGG